MLCVDFGGLRAIPGNAQGLFQALCLGSLPEVFKQYLGIELRNPACKA